MASDASIPLTVPLSQQLWVRNRDVIHACLHCAFVRGLADGTLPRSAFAYYVGQDAFFLQAFARAYSLAAAKTTTTEDFALFHGLATGVLEELNLHGRYAQEWGLDLAAVGPGAATRRYVDFLLATAWGQGPIAIAAAMVPCMRLYAHLGQELGRSGIPDHAYGPWIATYGGEEFEALAQRLEGLLDRHGQASLEIESAYRYAMDCELNFFEAAILAGREVGHGGPGMGT
ncbi:MAG: TenA family protein [Cyanobacteria bacterium]|nr:TenA family protein [Cyanobacteriota bacterium]